MAAGGQFLHDSDYCLDETNAPSSFYIIDQVNTITSRGYTDRATTGITASAPHFTRYGPQLGSIASAMSVMNAVNFHQPSCYLLGLCWEQDAWHLLQPGNVIWLIDTKKCLEAGCVIRSVEAMKAVHQYLHDLEPQKTRPSQWLSFVGEGGNPKGEILILNQIPKEAVMGLVRVDQSQGSEESPEADSAPAADSNSTPSPPGSPSTWSNKYAADHRDKSLPGYLYCSKGRHFARISKFNQRNDGSYPRTCNYHLLP